MTLNYINVLFLQYNELQHDYCISQNAQLS